MGYVYATINKDTLAHICKEKGVSSEFLASKTKLNMSRLNQWLTPTDINLPTINQAKKIAACLHIPFAGLYMNPCDIPLKRIPNIRNMRTMSGAVSIDDSSLNIAMIKKLKSGFFPNNVLSLKLTTTSKTMLEKSSLKIRR